EPAGRERAALPGLDGRRDVHWPRGREIERARLEERGERWAEVLLQAEARRLRERLADDLTGGLRVLHPERVRHALAAGDAVVELVHVEVSLVPRRADALRRRLGQRVRHRAGLLREQPLAERARGDVE